MKRSAPSLGPPLWAALAGAVWPIVVLGAYLAAAGQSVLSALMGGN
jgi:hypothetical protein